MTLHVNALQRQYAAKSGSSATTRIVKKRKPVAQLAFPLDPGPVTTGDGPDGPSTAAPAPASAPILPEPQELAAIAKLQAGDGLSSYDLMGLVEQCGICKLFFTGGVLRRHIFVCPCSEV